MDKRYEELLQYVERPARYIGGEINSIVKNWDAAELKVALIFPDIYDIGMSHLGNKILYHILNSRPNILCERAFAPWPDMEKALREKKLPLFSLESNRALSRFDVLGFSFSHELNYTNVLNILDMSGIPLRSKDRDSSYPLVIAGGPCAFNPEPMGEFMDAFLIGDGEESFPEIAEFCISLARKGMFRDKGALLEGISGISGVYIPGFYEALYKDDRFDRLIPIKKCAPSSIKKRVLKELKNNFYPTGQIVPYIPVVHDRVSLEIMRGCPHRCRFCQATMIYSPVRLRPKDAILELGRVTQARTGHDEISLLSLSTGDYPGITGILDILADEFKRQGISISLPSLRVEDTIESLPLLIQKIKKTGLTFAPEAGNDRLRKFIGKGINIDKLLVAAKKAYNLGWRRIKLYFMIGFPEETDSDIDSIINLAHQILDAEGRKGKAPVEITLSISSFIPKPHTIFQWEPMAEKDLLRNKIARLRQGVRTKKIKMNIHDINMSVLEAVFSRGDRRLSALLEVAFRKGARFDNWKDKFRDDIWQDALSECGLDIAHYTEGKRYCDPLPWGHIDSGINKDIMVEESILAHEEAGILSCKHHSG